MTVPLCQFAPGANKVTPTASAGAMPSLTLKNAFRPGAIVGTSELPLASTNAASKASLVRPVLAVSKDKFEKSKVRILGMSGIVKPWLRPVSKLLPSVITNVELL